MVRLLLVLAMLAVPASSRAWGRDGHRTVCEIAWQELSPAARNAVRELLPESGRYRRFSEACLWADNVRRRVARYAEDDDRHFLNIADGDTRLDLPRQCPQTCVVEAIDLYQRILQGEVVSNRSGRDALLFLAHYVGDVHQPLHAGYRSDVGGNKLAVRYYGGDPRCTWEHGYRSCEFNLHRAWDSLLIGDLIGQEGSWEPYALALHGRVEQAQRETWLASKPADWAQESIDLVTQEIYPFEDGAYVGRSYSRRHSTHVELRLQQAGVRLGGLLKALLE